MSEKRFEAFQATLPKIGSTKRKIFDLIQKSSSGVTIEQISATLNIKLSTVSARVSDLERDGLIYPIYKKKATHSIYIATPEDEIVVRRAFFIDKRINQMEDTVGKYQNTLKNIENKMSFSQKKHLIYLKTINNI